MLPLSLAQYVISILQDTIRSVLFLCCSIWCWREREGPMTLDYMLLWFFKWFQRKSINRILWISPTINMVGSLFSDFFLFFFILFKPQYSLPIRIELEKFVWGGGWSHGKNIQLLLLIIYHLLKLYNYVSTHEWIAVILDVSQLWYSEVLLFRL